MIKTHPDFFPLSWNVMQKEKKKERKVNVYPAYKVYIYIGQQTNQRGIMASENIQNCSHIQYTEEV